MLYFNVIVNEKELGQTLKDPTYTKIEVAPRSMRTFRDFRLRCFLPTSQMEVNTLKGMLKAQSNNPELPNEVREKIGGYYGNYANTMWISVEDFKELREIEQKYKISFCIPNKYNIYIHSKN